MRGKGENHVKKGNIRLPVAVRGSRTSVFTLPLLKQGLLKAVTTSTFLDNITADRLAQLVECRTSVREVVGSKSDLTTPHGL